MRSPQPLIGIPADRRLLGAHAFHCVGEKYLVAVADGAEAEAVVIPSLGTRLDVERLVRRFDALLFTGSPSNVEPHRYGGPPSDPGTLHDADRDATTLPLLCAAIDAGIPVLAICRGFQEMNVALGGTLHQKLHEVTGYVDHREDTDAALEVQYGPAHDVRLAAGGLLRQLAGRETIRVNSLHSQGVQRLAPRLQVEAEAPDGVIEAFRVRDVPQFAVGVQWHPEWQMHGSEFSRALFAAFGEAARRRAAGQGQVT